MSERLHFTQPVFTPSECIQFSAYDVAWGYRSFALSADTVRSQLGARDYSREQLLLAFNLNRPRIARAIENLSPCENGRPRIIGAADL
jgi:hypothetical protein